MKVGCIKMLYTLNIHIYNTLCSQLHQTCLAAYWWSNDERTKNMIKEEFKCPNIFKNNNHESEQQAKAIQP